MKLRRLYGFLIIAATVLLAVLCFLEIISIYCEGNTPENLSASGVYLRNVFSPEIIVAHFARIRWSFWLWAGFIVVGCFLPPQNQNVPKPSKSQVMYSHASPHWLRKTLYLTALALLVWGVLNGGMYDVLVKAIQICTECIGLG